MNILHIINGYVTSKLYKSFVQQLSNDIEHQSVFAPIRATEQNGINAIKSSKISIAYSAIVTNMIYRILFFLKIDKTVKEIQSEFNVNNHDIIHAHTLFSDGAAAYQLHRQTGIPYIVTLRNTDINEFFKYLFYLRPLGMKILLSAERVVFLSQAYQQRLLDNYVHKSLHEELMAKSLIIPNGIDDFWLNNIYTEHKKLGQTIRLLFTGEIRKNKNIIGIIDAISKIRNPNIEFLIIGKGLNDEEAYVKLVEEKILDNKSIKMLPAVAMEELLQYYRNADIFVMPSFTETFGLVYAEALSQGLPVIYSSGEGFDRVFDDGFVGLAVNSASIDDIARGIKGVVGSYEQMQSNCAASAKKFSWQRIAEVYLQNYSEINN